MHKETDSLLDALDKLKAAIDQADWLSAGHLDEQIKSNLELAIEQAKDEAEKQSLIGLLSHIQTVYQLLLENSEEARRLISLELKKITRDKKASALYHKAAHYK